MTEDTSKEAAAILDGVEEEETYDPYKELEKDNSKDSPSEKDQDGDTHSPDGDKDKNNQDDSDKDTPFHEHPRWKERETEWDKRFNDQESRHQDDLKKIREEFGQARKENAEQVKIPSWFGGDKEQWDEYRADRDKELKEAMDKTREETIQNFKSETTEADSKVKEATEYLQAEVKVLSTDKTLNPDGSNVPLEKLVKFTIENELVDTKGRWNYRAAFKMMKAQGLITSPKTVTEDRKKIGAVTTDKDSKGEPVTKTFKTSKDFKTNKPW